MTTEKAILAGGCFWGMQDLFRNIDGVTNTRVGYTGGHVEKATYSMVKNGNTGHAESIEINFDNEKISYEEILKFFFKIHDATTINRQGNDIGDSYRSAIFYLDNKQKETAEKVIKDFDKSRILPAKIQTELSSASEFWQAEQEHQDYLEKFPNGYTCHWIRPDWVIDN